MTEAEILFIRTLEDIEGRLLQADPYEILLISGLLRKLFLDDHPLVDQVNKEHRLKLTFDVTIPVSMPADGDNRTFWTVQDGLDPATAPPFRKHQNLSRDQFLGTVVTVANGRRFTVKDTILFEANVMGAIHAGSPRSEKEKALKELESSIAIGGYSTSLRQLQAIGRIVLKSLKPLRRAIG